MKPTQKQKLLSLLRDSQWHSNIEILNTCNIWRVSARIWDLQADGHRIEAKNGKQPLYWYRLIEEAKAS